MAKVLKPSDSAGFRPVSGHTFDTYIGSDLVRVEGLELSQKWRKTAKSFAILGPSGYKLATYGALSG